MTTPLTPPPMTEAQFRECGIITGPNLVGNCGPRYRSHGTQTNVWEKDLHALVAARDTQWAARVAELERDAARYRWLRHGDNDEKVIQRGPVAND